MAGSNFIRRAWARRDTPRGFALLVAIVLASVAAAVGIALSSIAYKSVRLSETSDGSQYAFYTADTALECGLYADQQLDAFDYAAHAGTPPSNSAITCVNASKSKTIVMTATKWNSSTIQYTSMSPSGYTNGWFPMNGYCARVTAYKSSNGATYIYSEGVSDCDTSDPRDLERGIYSNY